MRKALVTIALGEAFRANWERICRGNWESYAQKHGYDLVCIDRPLDESPRASSRSPSWQKCLILSGELAQYDRVVWVDADILINTEEAPCIVGSTPEDCVGAVNLWGAPTPEAFQRAWSQWREIWSKGRDVSPEPASGKEYYAAWGLPGGFDEVITASVMVLSPRHHRDLFEHVYQSYEDKGEDHWHFEMRPLSYEILKSGKISWLDPRFSTSWSIQMALHYPFLMHRRPRPWRPVLWLAQGLSMDTYARNLKRCVNIAFRNSYFFHFGPRKAEMPLIDTRCSRRELRDEEWFLPMNA